MEERPNPISDPTQFVNWVTVRAEVIRNSPNAMQLIGELETVWRTGLLLVRENQRQLVNLREDQRAELD